METYKYILGINGWNNSSHDASAILVATNQNVTKIVGGLEEEKVLRKKGLYDVFPTNAVRELLEICDVKVTEIAEIVIGWDYPKVYEILNKGVCLTNSQIISELFPGDTNLKIPIKFIDHHLSHAASSYYISDFDKAISLVVDGSGEDDSTSLWYFEGSKKRLIEKFDPSSSFGFLFEAVNLMLGFRENESGKTMGLAGYGNPIYAEQLLSYFDTDLGASPALKTIYQRFLLLKNNKLLLPYQEVSIKTWLYIFQYILKINKNSKKILSFYDFPQELKDLAASVQVVLEKKILNYVSQKCKELHTNQVCMSGGVALNCILNGKILDLDEVENIFVQPASGDSGVALGAALEYCGELGYPCQVTDFSPYIGKEYSDDEIKNYLNIEQISYTKVDNASTFIAQKLCDDKTVAVFQGKNEWGPRALGNRSILSIATKGKLDYINKEVKERELGRPLAPSLLIEDISQILSSSPKTYGKFMNIAYRNDKKLSGVDSIIHIDNTFRPQCVSEDYIPIFQAQLLEVKKLKGNSIVINTSFNGQTPIIYSLDQAVEFLSTRSLDYLVFNNKYILSKKDMV